MKTVFVSSTFRDFQSERDALHNQVLPRLKEQARAYGESVDFCDLRWGVDTSDAEGEEESSARVLTVCMNEIDRSRPHMLVLLGERYGFMPGSEAIRHEMARKAVDLEDLEISVTALEVEYGALHNPEGLSNTWFYFRELTAPEDDLPAEYGPESQRHREKLEALKARIKKVAGDRIRFYKAAYRDGQVEGLDDFVKMVQEDLGAQFAAEWSAFEQMHPYQKDALSQWNYLKSKAAAFSAFGGFAADLRERIAANRLTVVTGTAGSGKTTLFARVCMDMEAEGWNVVPFACGNTSLSTDGYGILKSLVWQLEELAGVDHIDPARAGDMAYMDPAHAGDMAYMDPAHAGGIANMDPAHAGGIAQMDSPRADGMRNMDSARTDDTADTRRSESTVTLSGEKKSSLEFLRDRLDEVCVLAEKKGRIVLAVDAVDQLAVGEMRDQLQFLPRVDLPEFRMFVTCLDSFRLPPALRPVRMPRLEESERETVVESILTTMGKELSTRVRRALTQKKQSDNPLYLYMAVSRLTLMDAEDFKTIHAMGDGMEAINAYQLSLIESMPEELPVLGVALVDAVAARVNPVMTDAAELIACTRHGLRLEDLRGILQETGTFSALEYAQFINFMSELFLLRSDGRYDFLHKSLRDGLKARTGEEKMREDHVRIAAWLEHLPEGDSVRIQELAWHLIQSDQKVKLLELISDRWSNELTPLMEATARALIEQSMSDGGAFMEETLGLLADCSAVLSGREEAGEISPERMAELIYHFVGLLARQMNDLFGRSVRELTVMRRVMESALTAAEQLTAEWPKEDRFPVVKSLIGRVLGECCLDQLSEESLRRALELFEDLVAAEGEKVNYTKVYLYTEMAKAAFNLETWEDIELASEYARKAIALIEDLEKSSGHKLGMESKSVLYAILAEIDEHLGTRESLEEALELLSQMEDWAEQDPETNKRTFANIFARKGMLLRRRRDEAGRAEGLAYYEKAVRLFREILLEEGDSSAVSNLARGYQMLGEAYIEEALRKEEKAYYGERGIALLRESIEIFDGLASKMGTRHVRNLAAYVRWNLAYAVEKLRGAREAEEIQREVVRLSAELAAENPLPILQANYATACGTLVRILAEQNIKEREEEALELAARTQRLCQENYEKYHMTEILRSESSVCYQVSRIYRRRGGRENLTAALEWEKRDLELMRELWRERGTETARTELYATLDSVIRILRDIGEADFLEEAAVLCREAVSLSEEIVKDQNTAKAREDLADTCELYGTVCRNRGGEEDKKEALFWFRRSLKEHEAVAGASDTRKTTESMQRLHREAGRICMGLGQEYLTDSLYHWQHAHDLAQLLC
ncbi:MAG: DUF4062 domain-containing protein, partial [Clostridiales bacterium]|nr:DUF4062 domain-containing protein [Clostridiales bacterium]